MPEFSILLRRGIRLPPAGWALACMLAFYVLAGLFGRDPWKGEDAIHIGAAWHVFREHVLRDAEDLPAGLVAAVRRMQARVG